MRMKVYNSLDCGVATRMIPQMLQRCNDLYGVVKQRIPVRQTVEQMARELGIASDYVVANFLLTNKSMTLGFDATTRNGVHINSIHLTSPSACYIMAVDHLVGGTSQDYACHIDASIDQVNITNLNIKLN